LDKYLRQNFVGVVCVGVTVCVGCWYMYLVFAIFAICYLVLRNKLYMRTTILSRNLGTTLSSEKLHIEKIPKCPQIYQLLATGVASRRSLM